VNRAGLKNESNCIPAATAARTIEHAVYIGHVGRSHHLHNGHGRVQMREKARNSLAILRVSPAQSHGEFRRSTSC
jgi:hypothetical protein